MFFDACMCIPRYGRYDEFWTLEWHEMSIAFYELFFFGRLVISLHDRHVLRFNALRLLFCSFFFPADICTTLTLCKHLSSRSQRVTDLKQASSSSPRYRPARAASAPPYQPPARSPSPASPPSRTPTSPPYSSNKKYTLS